MTRELKYFEAVREATHLCMEKDPNVYVTGLGTTDPKGIFGTTLGLEQSFGSERVFDMPTSENGMTGIAIGSAMMGMRPIMTHQRLDFFLLALDQLINNAAKWHFMFNGQMTVPLVIRLIVGRGWGQGPQHSQSLHSLFAHIPGIKVIAPAFPKDAKGLLISAIQDNNPVVFIEHRWLHNLFGMVPEGNYTIPIGKANIVREGTALTIVASSHMTIEAIQAANLLEKEGIDVEIVDLRSLKPIDSETIISSVKKTGKLLVLDGDWKTAGLAGEIIALVMESAFRYLTIAPARLTYPDHYVPTSWPIANQYYPTVDDIMREVYCLMGSPAKTLQSVLKDKLSRPLDVPDASFMGPF